MVVSVSKSFAGSLVESPIKDVLKQYEGPDLSGKLDHLHDWH